MTQKKCRKFINEMNRWAKAPDGTNLWRRRLDEESDEWTLHNDVTWNAWFIYIVDDEWAELRKAQTDGKQLQINYGSGWKDLELNDDRMENTSYRNWRIKPEVEFPVYRRRKESGCIARFDSEDTYKILMSSDIDSPIGCVVLTTEYYDRDDIWEPVETVEIYGETYYDTQPVRAWDNDPIYSELRFIDAKNGRVFSPSSGYRTGPAFENYAPIKCIEDWMVEAWKELKL